MKKFMFVVLVSFLIVALVFVQRGSISAVKASSSIYQGDLILIGNNVTTIEGRFDINGSIVVEENGTLILKNAVVNFTQTEKWEYNMTFRNPANGNPRLLAENTTLSSAYSFQVYFYGNSSGTADKLEGWPSTGGVCYLLTYDSSVVSISNSSMYVVVAGGFSEVNVFNSTTCYMDAKDNASVNFLTSTTNELWCYGRSHVNVSETGINKMVATEQCKVSVSNSRVYWHLNVYARSVNSSVLGLKPGLFGYWNFMLNCSIVPAPDGYATNITLKETRIDDWSLTFMGSSNATLSNSVIRSLSLLDYSVARLVNSTYEYCTPSHQSEVYVSWYLDVHVIDSEGMDVPSATVTAIPSLPLVFPNVTIAESQLTNSNGWVKLALMEKMMNATAEYPVRNYTVTSTYETHGEQQSVNMTENKQITIQLPFIIPEFPSFLILPLFMIATLLAVAIYRKTAKSDESH